MKYAIPIILSFFLFSCSKRNQIDINSDFLNGEWWSDSISTADAESRREFIFIDSLNKFYRTTWWSENYVIDKNLKIDKDIVSKDGKDYLKIVVIDSNKIELNGNEYYGVFERDPLPNIISFQNSLDRFIKGDSIKRILIGYWNLDNVLVKQIDDNAEYPIDYLNVYKNRNFLNQSPEKEIGLKFNIDNKLLVYGENKVFTYPQYIVDEEQISLSKSDYVINLIFKINDTELTIIEKRHGIERELIFKKTE